MATNNAKLPDTALLYQAGINPKTGLPLKAGCGDGLLKANLKSILWKMDEQDAINRYEWFNLPKGLTGQLLEKVLYYKGQGAFFYMETNDTFYFLPYALDGTIDVYGRFNSITPLPFAGGTTTAEGKEQPWIVGLKRDVAHNIILPRDLTYEDLLTKCVILHDVSTGYSDTNISRSVMADPMIDLMSDCLPFLRTALLSSTGVSGMKVNNQDEYANVAFASQAMNKAALNGEKWIPIVGSIDFQEMTGGNVARAEEFLLTMQSLDNLRLSTLGLDNGGLFQKKSHMLEAEQEMNAGNLGLIMADGLTLRQNFCNIINSIWGLGMWCEPAETAVGADMDMDGMLTPNAPKASAAMNVQQDTNEAGGNE